MENKKSPQRATQQLTIRLPEDTNNIIQEEAYRKGISVNSYIVLLLNEALNNTNLLT